MKELITNFCKEKLNDDVLERCLEILGKIENEPFLKKGKEIHWAGAVVHAIASYNQLFYKTAKPNTNVKVITDYFEVSAVTLTKKSKVIQLFFNENEKLGWFAMSTPGYFVNNRVVLNEKLVPIAVFPVNVQYQIRSFQAEGGDDFVLKLVDKKLTFDFENVSDKKSKAIANTFFGLK